MAQLITLNGDALKRAVTAHTKTNGKKSFSFLGSISMQIMENVVENQVIAVFKLGLLFKRIM